MTELERLEKLVRNAADLTNRVVEQHNRLLSIKLRQLEEPEVEPKLSFEDELDQLCSKPKEEGK